MTEHGGRVTKLMFSSARPLPDKAEACFCGKTPLGAAIPHSQQAPSSEVFLRPGDFAAAAYALGALFEAFARRAFIFAIIDSVDAIDESLPIRIGRIGLRVSNAVPRSPGWRRGPEDP